MNSEHTRKLIPIVDLLAEELEDLLTSEAFAKVRKLLVEASELVPYAVELSVEVDVADDSRETVLRVLTRGLCTSEGREPYVARGDATLARYIVAGDICEVPYDQCPHCWRAWDFKLAHPTCMHCGYALGHEVKLLLDSGVCRSCEDGFVTREEPVCTGCGFEVDESIVAWG